MMVRPIFVVVFSFLLLSQSSIAADSLAPNQTLLDDGTTLVSASQTFELGFFSPWNSNHRYIGIWFKNVPKQTVVWVANKNNPLTDSTGGLSITSTGNIVITSNQTNIIWTTNSSRTDGENPILQLLDNGNLLLRNRGDGASNSDYYLWQSFDHPGDTLIPGMKLGWNLRTNQEWYLTSWKSLQDPSPGDFTYRVDRRGLPQVVLRLGSQPQYRSGPWDGVRFGGGPALQDNPVFKPIFVHDTNNLYYSFQNIDDSIISRFVVNQSGLLKHLSWSQRRNDWVDIVTLQSDICDDYPLCGSYGLCNINGQPVCQCPPGFRPRLPVDWERLDWSGGCVRETPLNCSNNDIPVGFRKFSKLKLPDASNFLANSTARNPDECKDACLRNCSCTAYAKTEVSGCVAWFGDLLDIRTYNEGGQDLYIKMPLSELGSSKKKIKRTAVIASVSALSGVILLALIGWYLLWKRNYNRTKALETPEQENQIQAINQRIGDEDLELPLFDLVTISAATKEFSFTNKIGEGGFGPVYKGVLSTGQEIAVKRLSKDSGQGLKEFKNEVILIAKLQHRNLVKLLGCCIDGEERVLIYEYMPNRSLDLIIFDRRRSKLLDWHKRFAIIVGIARGLLYLHRDSRLRIIHRDLKASNILLDNEMNPKISDFGMARTFGNDQYQENTGRVMGTYGYMSPEYAVDGLFSVKSDVFSFGVLLLEIVSGKKNRGFDHPDHDLNLLGHAWNLWNAESPMKLVDASIESSAPESEVLRCIQIGLLCVQQRTDDRPNMSTVLLMLDSENPSLPYPKQPGFYTERTLGDTDTSSTGKQPYASNEITVTLLQGR